MMFAAALSLDAAALRTGSLSCPQAKQGEPAHTVDIWLAIFWVQHRVGRIIMNGKFV
jgi:hypothetical protein